MKSARSPFFAAAALALLLAPVSSWATLYGASVSIGSGTGDCPCSASATFNVTNGQIVVTLTNTLSIADFISAGQALSDIIFTLSDAPGTLGSTSASGQFGDIDGSGNLTYTSSDTLNGNTTPLRWLGQGPNPPGGKGFFDITGNTITLEAIGGGQPSQMIAPFLANGGVYTSANNGVQQHNSYVIGSAEFTLALSGVTADTVVTAANFSFGTGPDVFSGNTTPVPIPEAPEPATLALIGFGLAAVGFFRRGRKQ